MYLSISAILFNDASYCLSILNPSILMITISCIMIAQFAAVLITFWLIKYLIITYKYQILFEKKTKILLGFTFGISFCIFFVYNLSESYLKRFDLQFQINSQDNFYYYSLRIIYTIFVTIVIGGILYQVFKLASIYKIMKQRYKYYFVVTIGILAFFFIVSF